MTHLAAVGRHHVAHDRDVWAILHVAVRVLLAHLLRASVRDACLMCVGESAGECVQVRAAWEDAYAAHLRGHHDLGAHRVGTLHALVAVAGLAGGGALVPSLEGAGVRDDRAGEGNSEGELGNSGEVHASTGVTVSTRTDKEYEEMSAAHFAVGGWW